MPETAKEHNDIETQAVQTIQGHDDAKGTTNTTNPNNT